MKNVYMEVNHCNVNMYKNKRIKNSINLSQPSIVKFFSYIILFISNFIHCYIVHRDITYILYILLVQSTSTSADFSF